VDQDPNDIYDEGLAMAREWREAERRKFAATDEGSWLLRAIAEESDGRLVEMAPGCFIESKLDPPAVTPPL
jgi:hypothetical protein